MLSCPTERTFCHYINNNNLRAVKPKTLWDKYKERSLSEDVLREARRANPTIDLNFCPEIFNHALILLQDKCISINGKTLSELGLGAPTRSDFQELDRDILRERNYNIDELEKFVDKSIYFLLFLYIIYIYKSQCEYVCVLLGSDGVFFGVRPVTY
jgi:hypothetical protein